MRSHNESVRLSDCPQDFQEWECQSVRVSYSSQNFQKLKVSECQTGPKIFQNESLSLWDNHNGLVPGCPRTLVGWCQTVTLFPRFPRIRVSDCQTVPNMSQMRIVKVSDWSQDVPELKCQTVRLFPAFPRMRLWKCQTFPECPRMALKCSHWASGSLWEEYESNMGEDIFSVVFPQLHSFYLWNPTISINL